MKWLRWLVIIAAMIEAGYMVIDGNHALTTGDYITPTSGPHAGELGPWASVVSLAGIQPRSAAMKEAFVTLGCAWLVAAFAFALRVPRSSIAMIVFAFGTLWYVPIGTCLSIVQLVALGSLRSVGAKAPSRR